MQCVGKNNDVTNMARDSISKPMSQLERIKKFIYLDALKDAKKSPRGCGLAIK